MPKLVIDVSINDIHNTENFVSLLFLKFLVFHTIFHAWNENPTMIRCTQ